MKLPAVAAGESLARRLFASIAAAALVGSADPFTGSSGVPAALAKTDSAAIGTCLLTKAPGSLARCLTDPSCAANLICINTCTNRPDESECQIKCGDEFSSPVVDAFTKAVVTEKKCVPQREDDGSWPVPKDDALVKTFRTDSFVGDWYISAGYNKAFDVFDCQLHRFEAPTPTTLVGNLQWRIKDPIAGTNFVTRYTVQTFEQDPTRQGILYNHDNEFLHYQDDWYLLAQKEDAYVVVYYRGSNDAWDGYGGAVVYTRDPVLPAKYVPELRAAVSKVGLDWDKFTLTDNSCRAAESKLEELENDLVFVETRVAKGISTTEQELVKELEKDVVAIEREVEKDVVAIEREVEKDVVAIEREVVKDVTNLEREVEKDVGGLFGRKR